jgi:hypothetical protein
MIIPPQSTITYHLMHHRKINLAYLKLGKTIIVLLYYINIFNKIRLMWVEA